VLNRNGGRSIIGGLPTGESLDHGAIKGSHHDLTSLIEHDLIGNPVSTFPDRALEATGFRLHR
jgi:hypothetical protein